MDRRCGTWLGVGSRQGPGTIRLAADRRIVPNSQLGRVSCSKRWTFGTTSRCVPSTADQTQCGFRMAEFFTCRRSRQSGFRSIRDTHEFDARTVFPSQLCAAHNIGRVCPAPSLCLRMGTVTAFLHIMLGGCKEERPVAE